jgi:arylsulfatase A-like enzyme|tara:strand:+ start:18645 stop:18986 length:342 start_codon:yes stop_codon:yes gene_type:complete
LILRPPVPQRRGKGSVYRGGINALFIVTGPEVPQGEVSEALANSANLFITIMELAGLNADDAIPYDVVTDSVSFRNTLLHPSEISNRDWIFVDELFGSFAGIETANYAIRNKR